MKRILPTILFLLTVISASAQLFYDRSTNTYLRSIPEQAFDDDRLDEYRSDTADIRLTFLPIVRINGDFGYDHTPGTMILAMPDGTITNDMPMKAKWRGGTTNTSGKHKRNYSVKFLKPNGSKQDRKFFGLRNDNHWILEACQVDMSRVRNRVATDLWNDFAAKPYYFDREPKALTGTRGQFVELFLNDEYRGIYCMTECIDRSQLKLKKYTDNADGTQTIRGQLWKGKDHEYTAFGWYGPYDNTSENWGGFYTEYPDIEDVMPTDYSLLYDACYYCCNSTDEEFAATSHEYFDIPVIIDYTLLVYLLNAVDNNNGKNIYWACYDRTADKMLTPAVWDLDCTVGQYFDPSNCHSDLVSPDTIYEISFWSHFRLDTFNIDGFHDKLVERYLDLRNNHFSYESLSNRYSNYMTMLAKSGAYRREKDKWNHDSDIGGNELDFTAELQYITNWISRRLEVLDDFLVPTSQGIIDVHHRPHDSHTYNLLGQPIATPERGIYIKEGKKYHRP